MEQDRKPGVTRGGWRGAVLAAAIVIPFWLLVVWGVSRL